MMKYKILTLIILIAAFVLAGISPEKYNLPDINEVFPKKITTWESEEVTIDKSVYNFLEKEEILLRTYTNTKTSQKLSLAIVITDKRDHIHDPEICYRGQGISMDSEKTINIDKKLKARLVKGQKSEKPYNIIYWYTDFSETYAKRVTFMKNITKAKLFNTPLKGFALIVIIAPDEGNKEEIKTFSQNTYNELKQIL